MVTINPYLNFPGNTEDAFNFYKSIFGGEFTVIQRFKDTPEADKMSEEEQNKLMHISLPIGKNNVLMGTDVMGKMAEGFTQGNNFYLSIATESEEATERIFNGLSAGGQVFMELQKTFWNAYFGMLKDKFGIKWMVNYDYK